MTNLQDKNRVCAIIVAICIVAGLALMALCARITAAEKRIDHNEITYAEMSADGVQLYFADGTGYWIANQSE